MEPCKEATKEMNAQADKLTKIEKDLEEVSLGFRI